MQYIHVVPVTSETKKQDTSFAQVCPRRGVLDSLTTRVTPRPSNFKTAPDPDETGWPKGIPYIIGNEGCERFSYYGMTTILLVYLEFLYAQNGLGNEKERALETVHFFGAAVYALPMVGAVVADRWLGKYNTILWLSLVYCAGHAALAFLEGTPSGVYLGLALIALGAGGIKPCVSANVGDQFGKSNQDKLERIYQAFYFIINLGAGVAMVLTPWVKRHYGWGLAFGFPGILMAIATALFWLGRNKFVHVPPNPGGKLGFLDAASSAFLLLAPGSLLLTTSLPWLGKAAVAFGCVAMGAILAIARQKIQKNDGFLLVIAYGIRAYLKPKIAGERRRFWQPAIDHLGEQTVEGPRAVANIISVFLLVSMFWSLFEQRNTSWVQQAGLMDRHIVLPWMGAFDIEKEQITALNPILVMALIPLISFGVYPVFARVGFTLTPLRRITLGMLIASTSFVATAIFQERLEAGAHIHVLWQLVPYTLVTIAEVMVSVTGLEFAYTQAPSYLKSTILSLWLFTVALGNVFVGLFSALGHLPRVQFFWTFAGLMAVAGILFGIRAAFYKERTITVLNS